MAEKMAGMDASDSWSKLLQESRLALSTLQAGALEELAGRAECMLAATVGGDPIRQRIARPQLRRVPGIVRECGLLRDLLDASDRNLRVLRGIRGDSRIHRRGEAIHPWVR
jgi:hypothetical protein